MRKVYLLKNPSEDADLGRPDPYEEHIAGARFVPVLEFEAVDVPGLEAVLLKPIDGLIVTSQRAVDVLKTALDNTASAADILKLPTYTVGPATAGRLASIGFRNVFGAETGHGEALANYMLANCAAAQSLLFVAGEIHRPTLPNKLTAAGHKVHTQIVYRTRAIDCAETLRANLREGDWLVFFSPSGSAPAVEFVKSSGLIVKIASIGPTTLAYLQNMGINVDAVAEHPTAESLADVIARLEV